MGYYTRYQIHTFPPIKAATLVKYLDPFLGDDEILYDLDPDCVVDQPSEVFEEAVKWYEHNDHMVKLSQAQPEIVFILDGEGEDAGDVWRKFYLNGQVHEWRPDTTPPDYDPTMFE